MMIRFVFTALYTCAIIRGAHAQTVPIYGLGINGGMNLARFTEKGTINNFLLASHFGFSVEQRFGQRVSMSYELQYARYGNVTFFTNPGLFEKVRTQYDYLTLPISLRYRFRKYPFFLIPGFQVGYLLANRTEFLPKNGYTNNNIPYLKKIDYGFSIGLGCRFGNRIFGEVKYYQSLRTLIKENVPLNKRYNQVISAGLTYYPFTK